MFPGARPTRRRTRRPAGGVPAPVRWIPVTEAVVQEGIGAIEAYYTVGDLGPAILRALDAAGMGGIPLDTEDLAPVDAFHMRGREATRELAEAAGLEEGSDCRVLDVGAGLGGTARFLAETYGCEVEGIDAVDEYCRVARMLSARTELDGRTTFRLGSALDLPFEDESFDVVWTEHAQMNVRDKERFYGEIARVLEPGGRFVFNDVFQGDGGDAILPATWADDASISFLCEPEEATRILEAEGLRTRTWDDVTGACLEWRRSEGEDAGDPPALGLHLLLGDSAEVKVENEIRNLDEGRVTTIQGIAEKDG